MTFLVKPIAIVLQVMSVVMVEHAFVQPQHIVKKESSVIRWVFVRQTRVAQVALSAILINSATLNRVNVLQVKIVMTLKNAQKMSIAALAKFATLTEIFALRHVDQIMIAP